MFTTRQDETNRHAAPPRAAVVTNTTIMPDPSRESAMIGTMKARPWSPPRGALTPQSAHDSQYQSYPSTGRRGPRMQPASSVAEGRSRLLGKVRGPGTGHLPTCPIRSAPDTADLCPPTPRCISTTTCTGDRKIPDRNNHVAGQDITLQIPLSAMQTPPGAKCLGGWQASDEGDL